MEDHRFYYNSIQYNGTNKLKGLYKDHVGRFSWEEIGLIIRIAACKESVDHYYELDLGFSSEYRRANRSYKKACRDLYRLRKAMNRKNNR